MLTGSEACCDYPVHVCLMSHLLSRWDINGHSYLVVSDGMPLWMSLMLLLMLPLVYLWLWVVGNHKSPGVVCCHLVIVHLVEGFLIVVILL